MECAIRKVKDEWGWLGNMSRHPIEYKGIIFHSAEALFQFLRFQDRLPVARDEVMQDIINEPNPFKAKLIAKKNAHLMTVDPKSDKDVANMERVLRLKINQHPDLKKQLIETGDAFIVEDIGGRKGGNHDFWGARKIGDKWVGENTVGNLWMKIGEEIKEA